MRVERRPPSGHVYQNMKPSLSELGLSSVLFHNFHDNCTIEYKTRQGVFVIVCVVRGPSLVMCPSLTERGLPFA